MVFGGPLHQGLHPMLGWFNRRNSISGSHERQDALPDIIGHSDVDSVAKERWTELPSVSWDPTRAQHTHRICFLKRLLVGKSVLQDEPTSLPDDPPIGSNRLLDDQVA